MRMSEITVNENFILKALGMGKGAAPAAAKIGADDAASAAAKARGDAFLKRATGGPQAVTSGFKAGDMVNVDLRAYKNAPGSQATWQQFSGLDNDIAKVVEIIPFPNQPGSFLAKVESTAWGHKAGKERIMHKGQHIGWKDVPAEIKSYTIPVEFLSIRK